MGQVEDRGLRAAPAGLGERQASRAGGRTGGPMIGFSLLTWFCSFFLVKTAPHTHTHRESESCCLKGCFHLLLELAHNRALG